MGGARRWTRAVAVGAALVAAVAIGYAVLSPGTVRTGGAGGAAGAAERGSPTPPAPHRGTSGQPLPPGDRPGWRLAFSDDFSGSALGSEWFPYTGVPEGDPEGYFDPSHVSVTGGLLDIGAWRDAARGNRYVTGGVSLKDNLAQTYGRWDIRFRMDRGHGIAFALLLWPKTNVFPPEIDLAEDNGRDRDTVYATLHPARPGSPAVSRSVATDTTTWHTAGLRWTPGLIVLTLDDREWGRIPGAVVPNQPMTLGLQTQSWGCGHQWEACPDASTPPRVDLQVDWVAQYAWRP